MALIGVATSSSTLAPWFAGVTKEEGIPDGFLSESGDFRKSGDPSKGICKDILGCMGFWGVRVSKNLGHSFW